jgi:acyl-CoA dehydrogenase
MAKTSLRRDVLSRPIFSWARRALPRLSATEREAVAAGDVWWDAALFSGNPNWQELLDVPPAALSEEEGAFLDGPVDELCAMLDDWKIFWEERELPDEAWRFMKEQRIFGMIIPKPYGGLEFGPYAHSEVIRRISTRSVAAAVTVMVPNSLGPGELVLKFGTDAQKQHWLPRLADGREIPAFALTSPEAGSDAASMSDTGVVCKSEHENREVVGLRLNWKKRYITLGPVATVLGVAFKLRDPDHILSDEEERGITLALIPTNTPGVEIGRRHLPALQAFQNGPNAGHDVFVPLDVIIGGEAQIGRGWTMLNAALAAGRGISLPSLSAAGAALAARTTGAYARVRRQFNLPIGQFEGVQERLARLAANAYALDAGRRLTCAGLALGRHPSVISAIMKSHATELMRQSANDAMDVHAGKAVIDGPRNYLANLYRAAPVGITVEGANILTRSLIIFGQGAIRAHPHMLKEIEALSMPDAKEGLEAFDKVLWRHVGHLIATAGRAFVRTWSDGWLAPAPAKSGAAKRYYKKLSRYAADFALAADVALLTMGGRLKRMEMLSARLGDILCELFLLSGVLKRWHDEGGNEADLPLVDYIAETGFLRIERRLRQILRNFPSRAAALLLEIFILPFGVIRSGPRDDVTRAAADLLLLPSAARDRVTGGVFDGSSDEPLARLEDAFERAIEAEDAYARLRKLDVADWRAAKAQGLISAADAEAIERAERTAAIVTAVDDFAPEALTPRRTREAVADVLPVAAE